MIFDDHEIIDDWNTSAAWRADMRAAAWWPERITSGLASYWVYQHLGNLAPDELAADPVYAKVAAAEDATELLREFGARVDRSPTWRTTPSAGGRAVPVELRARPRPHPAGHAGQPVQPGARPRPAGRCCRRGEWAWFLDQAHGDYDHLVVGSSLPWLLPPAIHHLEAWNERLADSRRARVARAVARSCAARSTWSTGRRSGAPSTRWPSCSPARRGRPGRSGAPGRRRPAYAPPASISVLSGDVHHSYVARADLATRRWPRRCTSSPARRCTTRCRRRCGR